MMASPVPPCPLIPEALVKLIVTTDASTHCATIASVTSDLAYAVDNSSLQGPEFLLLQKQLSRFERFDQLLSRDKSHEVLPHPKMKTILHNMLAYERESLKKNILSRKAAIVDKMWSDFEYLFTKEIHEPVNVQNFIIDLVINMVIITGESYTQQLFNDDEKKQVKGLNDQIKAARDAYNAKKAEITATTNQAISLLAQGFQSSLTAIQNTEGVAPTRFAQEITYINRMINLTKPACQLLVNPIQQDLFFNAAPMSTPNNGYKWYNVYQITDWEFDSQLGGFIQRGPTGSQPAYIQQSLCQQWQSKTSTPGKGPACVWTNGQITADSNSGCFNSIFTRVLYIGINLFYRY